MRKQTALFLSISVLLWILPLGNFIKPSQEKTACGGGRAMHMCTMGMGKVSQDTSSSKISFTNAGSVEKEPRSSSGSAGNDLLSELAPVQTQAHTRSFSNDLFIFPYKISRPLSSPPPKTFSLV